MVYSRFVEVGRVALVSVGPYQGKLVVIVDVIDQNRALVDGPTTGVPRQAVNFKALVLTDFTVKIQHGCREKAVRKAVQDSDLVKKWEATAWAKKLARRKRRRALSDFDRYMVKVLKQKKSKLVRTTYNKLKKEQKV